MYQDGAIIANKRLDYNAASDDMASKIEREIDLVVGYNNKAVINLKRGSLAASRQYSQKSIEIMEPRVFGMINSGLIAKNGQQQNEDKTNSFFREILQVLLVSYFNLAQSKDQEPSSKEIYLQGMQLAYQYLPGARRNYLYQKFELKYKRKMYLLLQSREASFFNERLGPDQQLPEIFPLDQVTEVTSKIEETESHVSPNFPQNNV